MDRIGKRALLTGASGFTGRYVRAELESRGYLVYGMGARTADGSEGVEICADLRDSEQLASVVQDVRPNVVVHLAALAFVGHAHVNDFYEVNLVGTRNLLKALSESGIAPEAVLLVSSANIYGNASEGTIDESVKPAPANDYAVSKLAMEYMASLWRDQLPLIVARPFNYTGVGQSANFLVPKIVDHFRRRAKSIELGNLDVWRDFSDVRFIAQVYGDLIANREAVGQVVNVCSGVALSLREIIMMCEEIAGYHINVKVNPDFMRANEVKTLRGDPALLRRLTGAGHGPALRKTLEWMLAA